MTMREYGRIAAAAALGLAAPGGALAESDAEGAPAVLGCGARMEMIAHLQTQYGETFSGAAKESPRGLMELYVSVKGAWTLLLTKPDGTSCPVAVGSDVERDFGGAFRPGEQA